MGWKRVLWALGKGEDELWWTGSQVAFKNPGVLKVTSIYSPHTALGLICITNGSGGMSLLCILKDAAFYLSFYLSLSWIPHSGRSHVMSSPCDKELKLLRNLCEWTRKCFLSPYSNLQRHQGPERSTEWLQPHGRDWIISTQSRHIQIPIPQKPCQIIIFFVSRCSIWR